MDYHPFITIDPEIRNGKPIIRGTRMTVSDVLDYLAGGMSIQDIVDDFPYITSNDVKGCLSFAADRERRKL